ncbi:hypothetical protein [Algoriphagus sp. NG3]|uniref:hypothetical protein n=1 Tax=Algoriphagus sp. NG3 TaxID=3097546 RepID=UPI002A82DE4D|nr:hypothetical protein [Algoriphagus sp. NG3]WPR75741.1 hypothetical protein SLW71_00055 [Algoriphagus sp. NG3]
MNKIIRMALLMIFVCMPFFYAQSQSGYLEEEIWSRTNPTTGLESDFIITSSGIKLFGKIISNYDYSNYDKVEFEHNGSLKTYFPADLQAFGLSNGRFFMSKKLDESSSLEFVQILFSGKLQLDYKKGKYYIDNGIEIQELRSYYQDVTYDGEKRRKRIKLYISTLKILTAGSCGFELTELIEKSSLDEQDFIKILTQYHECEKLPYKLHVEKIPFVQISPTVALGIGGDFTKASEILEGVNYAFSNSLSYKALAGLRLHDFRKFPKSSIDLRVGYQMKSSTLDVSYIARQELITASQEFQESTIVIPFSYNFSIIKRGEKDIYVGLVLTAWLSSLKNELTIIEQSRINVPEVIFLYERDFMTLTDYSVKPGVKVGANLPLAGKMKLFTEMEVDFFNNFYSVQVLNLPGVDISRTYVSLQFGLQF